MVNFPGYGLVVWAARTLAGANVLESPWKYLTTRRLADYITHSLKPSMRWATFEPNGPALWSALDAEATAFPTSLYSAGAFAGQTVGQCFQVTVDATTTSAADIAAGLINIDIFVNRTGRRSSSPSPSRSTRSRD